MSANVLVVTDAAHTHRV